MRILHICDGWEPANGAANIARMIAAEQTAKAHSVACYRFAPLRELRRADEIWVHCGWKPCLWWAVLAAIFLRRKPSHAILRWMPEACHDPIRLAFHGWKKRLVGPIERFCLRRCTSIVATCEAEAEWIRTYLHLPVSSNHPDIEVTDIKRFFDLRPKTIGARQVAHRPIRILYLGRRHPLKGTEYLERAVRELNESSRTNEQTPFALRIESNLFGADKEAAWQWCDIFCLPTLSENFGLVIAEALARGKRVITTDGAPAWAQQGPWANQLTFLRGFRDGTDETRRNLLKDALKKEL